jgi:hypothetical protein
MMCRVPFIGDHPATMTPITVDHIAVAGGTGGAGHPTQTGTTSAWLG